MIFLLKRTEIIWQVRYLLRTCFVLKPPPARASAGFGTVSSGLILCCVFVRTLLRTFALRTCVLVRSWVRTFALRTIVLLVTRLLTTDC